MRKSAILLLVSVTAILTTGCSEGPETTAKKEPPKPPEPVTARVAFHQMYLMARSWSTDVEGWRMESVHLKSVPSGDGKYGAWRATFVSPSKRAAKSYSYSVIEGEGLYKGVFGGPDESYSGPRGQTSPFPTQALKIDSDAALKTAMEKGTEYSKKNPDKPIHFLLENNKRFPNLTWRVIWGDSVGTSNFSIFVDASTGEYLQTMR